ncbi:hypothetical protein GDO81_028948 [Engystomops pustulosus]|uniref:Uncharacterized protein n=1 Tax=Engystomops pustulosus TaxID=76066 RepID=A0AAV6Z4W1_ENGPU|nr:hypothetical protein GDO81_028948 [Engystomops pustulosus]
MLGVEYRSSVHSVLVILSPVVLQSVLIDLKPSTCTGAVTLNPSVNRTLYPSCIQPEQFPGPKSELQPVSSLLWNPLSCLIWNPPVL